MANINIENQSFDVQDCVGFVVEDCTAENPNSVGFAAAPTAPRNTEDEVK